MKRIALVVSMIVAGASAAHARERVAIGAFKTSGAKLDEPSQRETARTKLVGGLEAAGFEVVSPAELQRALSGTTGLVNCDSTPCLRRIGELTNARYVVRAELEQTGDNWRMAIEVVDVQDQSTAAHVSDQCRPCSDREATDKLSDVAASMRDRLPKPPPITQPPIAQPPQTPMTPIGQPPPREVPRFWRPLGIGAIALGGVALVAGIALLAIDNHVTGHGVSGGYVVQTRYDTLAGGAVLVAGGLALAGGGIFCLWHDHRLRRSVALAPSVAPSHVGLLLDARF